MHQKVDWWRALSMRVMGIVILLGILLIASVAVNIVNQQFVQKDVSVKIANSEQAMTDVEYMRDGFSNWNRKIMDWAYLQQEMLTLRDSKNANLTAIKQATAGLIGDIPNQIALFTSSLKDMEQHTPNPASQKTLQQLSSAVQSYNVTYVAPLLAKPTPSNILLMGTAGQTQATNMAGYLDTLLQNQQSLNTQYATEITNAFNSGRDISLILLVLTIVFAVAGSLYVSFAIRPIRVLMTYLTRVSENDLAFSDVPVRGKDEFGILARIVERMVQNLKTILQDVQKNAEQVAASSEQLTASSEETSHAAQNIALSVQEMSEGTDRQFESASRAQEATDQVFAGIQQIGVIAGDVSSASNEATKLAQNGKSTVREALQQMNRIRETVEKLSISVNSLGDRSREIGDITGAITAIATQTNLLSLNAAIEAARAGEHGKGFAVVAAEVRNLAEQSSTSAQRIADLISGIQSDMTGTIEETRVAQRVVMDGVAQIEATDQVFSTIVEKVESVSTQITGVTATVEAVTIGSREMAASVKSVKDVTMSTSGNVQNVAASTEEQLAAMQEIAASATSLSHMAVNLHTLVEEFKL